MGKRLSGLAVVTLVLALVPGAGARAATIWVWRTMQRTAVRERNSAFTTLTTRSGAACLDRRSRCPWRCGKR
jgi:hypothetical protein